MRIIAVFALFVLSGVSINGQSSGYSSAESRTSDETVKGAPFSAEEVNESIQVLNDGNRIVRRSSNKLFRDGQGRFRRELSGGSGGSFGTFYSFGPGITILDPVSGNRYMLDSRSKTAWVGPLRRDPRFSPGKEAVPDKAKPEPKSDGASARSGTVGKSDDRDKGRSGDDSPGEGDHYGNPFARRSKYQTKTEDLGTRTIEGVEASGKRTVTTIPAGDIGNERPIEIVYEKWYSNYLQLVVMSRHSDPRYGEQTYRLTNITRNEPDPSLFEVPKEYKINSSRGGRYTISSSSEKTDGQGRSSGSGSNSRSSKPELW